jgi:hypothetical protein
LAYTFYAHKKKGKHHVKKQHKESISTKNYRVENEQALKKLLARYPWKDAKIENPKLNPYYSD